MVQAYDKVSRMNTFVAGTDLTDKKYYIVTYGVDEEEVVLPTVSGEKFAGVVYEPDEEGKNISVAYVPGDIVQVYMAETCSFGDDLAIGANGLAVVADTSIEGDPVNVFGEALADCDAEKDRIPVLLKFKTI